MNSFLEKVSSLKDKLLILIVISVLSSTFIFSFTLSHALVLCVYIVYTGLLKYLDDKAVKKLDKTIEERFSNLEAKLAVNNFSKNTFGR